MYSNFWVDDKRSRPQCQVYRPCSTDSATKDVFPSTTYALPELSASMMHVPTLAPFYDLLCEKPNAGADEGVHPDVDHLWLGKTRKDVWRDWVCVLF